MMTPEPTCSPCAVITFSLTTAGSTFAIATSCCVCKALLLPEETDEAVVVGIVLLLLPAANSHPANKPMPKTMSSTNASTMRVPLEPCCRCGGVGVDGGAEGV